MKHLVLKIILITFVNIHLVMMNTNIGLLTAFIFDHKLHFYKKLVGCFGIQKIRLIIVTNQKSKSL